MITETTDKLPPLTQEDRAAIAALPRDIATHDAHMATLGTMTRVELGGACPAARLDFPLTIAAWNLERCLFPAESAAKLAEEGAQVVLLSEMDNGMARTQQNHTTALVAEGLGMQFAYGVEFIELGLGSGPELQFCTDIRNLLGLHGNALMASVPLRQVFMLRLAGQRRWFTEGGDQPRMGERMAIGALIDTAEGPLVVVSVHLESHGDAPLRQAQIAGLIDGLEAAFPAVPIVIGGDLNSGNQLGGDWRAESFFAHAESRGFSTHSGEIGQMTTRPSLLTPNPSRAQKLDWFLTRGVRVSRSWIVPSTDASGRPLSDHDMVVLTLDGLTAD